MADQDSTTPEGVDLARLRPWFASHVEDAEDAPLHAELIAGGRSNLTYAITQGPRTWVLRRPPLGHVVATAHDMAREHRVISALAGSEVPVPRAFAFCDDTAVNDAPFYVMERVDGRILRSPEDMSDLSDADATRISHALVDTLARLHAVDYDAAGLGDFGRPDGFLARNVARWGKQWEANKTRELPTLDEVARRLDAALPESGPAAIVHGDYRLDNTMLALDDPGGDVEAGREALVRDHAHRDHDGPAVTPAVLDRVARRLRAGTADRAAPALDRHGMMMAYCWMLTRQNNIND